MLIKDMILNQNIECTLAVVDAKLKDAKNGTYLHLILADKKQDQIEGKVWQYPTNGTVPPSGLIVDISGTVGEYNGKKDINIKHIGHNQNVNLEEFLGYDEVKIKDIYNKLIDKIYNLNTWDFVEIGKYIMTNYVDEICKGVGAKSVHHNNIGGYLQHTYEVMIAAEKLCEVCDVMNVTYNKDLVILGSILHDLGKIKAYQVTGLKIEESTPGQLIDHMALSIIMIENAYNSLPTVSKDENYYHLLHIIQSHHGCKEWGSPVPPKTIEAQIIHVADNFSAKIEIMNSELNKCNHEWTEKIWSLGGIKLYKGIEREL